MGRNWFLLFWCSYSKGILCRVDDSDTTDSEFPLLSSLENTNKKEKAKVHFNKVSRVEEYVKAISEESEDEQEYRVSAQKHVIIDVGGERFQAEKERFLKFPNTRLGTKYISEIQ